MPKLLSLNKDTVSMYCSGCDALHTVPVNTTAPNAWTFNGDVESPTLAPSLLVNSPNANTEHSQRCHSFIRNGQWQYLNDCTHELAGETVDMDDIELHRDLIN